MPHSYGQKNAKNTSSVFVSNCALKWTTIGFVSLITKKMLLIKACTQVTKLGWGEGLKPLEHFKMFEGPPKPTRIITSLFLAEMKF